MTKAILRLAAATLFCVAVPLSDARPGDPIPGVDVSLEQIPGGRVATTGQCRSKGGSVVRRSGKTYCAFRRRTGTRIRLFKPKARKRTN